MKSVEAFRSRLAELKLEATEANRGLVDGKVVVLYYFSRKGPDPERFIAATIWAPPGA